MYNIAYGRVALNYYYGINDIDKHNGNVSFIGVVLKGSLIRHAD